MTKGYKAFDVVYVDFGDIEFSGEQGGKRPALIIQNDKGNKFSPTTIVLPFTTELKNEYLPTHTLFNPDEDNGLHEKSMLLGECIRQISEKRIIKKIGSVENMIDRIRIKKVYQANFAWNGLEG